jgi:hypothetical protein
MPGYYTSSEPPDERTVGDVPGKLDLAGCVCDAPRRIERRRDNESSATGDSFMCIGIVIWRTSR